MQLRSLIVYLLAFGASHVEAQMSASVKNANFKSSATEFQQELVKVREVLKDIKLDQLPISYAEGKLIDKSVDLAIQNLDLEASLIAKVLRSGSLTDEIDLLSTTQEIGYFLQDISSSLLAVELHDQKATARLTAWTAELQTETRPVENFYEQSYRISVARADFLEHNDCSKKGERPSR